MFGVSRNRKRLGVLAIFGIIIYTTLHLISNNSVNSHLRLYPGQNENNSCKLKEILKCSDIIPSQSFFGQRGNHWVLYNYFRATLNFECDKSITYTTHSDWTFLDNLIPLLERWQGPLSIALYSPGTDFQNSLIRIQYLRECINTTLIKDLVTFHLIFDQNHVPTEEIFQEPGNLPVNCSDLENSNFTIGGHAQTYKTANNLTYPVNVARNVARDSATTHFVFPSDIELYTSPGLIENFLEMIKRNDSVLHTSQPKVFVVPIFEVSKNVDRLPNNKAELIYMLKNNSAVQFHKYTCPHCQRIPEYDEWMNVKKLRPGLHVFHVGKRYQPYQHWEPIFIGTRSDPIYDERLSWEGRMDKMTQGYILCVLDYEFLILDNAFLIHRPGIKRPKGKIKVSPVMKKQTNFIMGKILPELQKIYGTRSGCVIN